MKTKTTKQEFGIPLPEINIMSAYYGNMSRAHEIALVGGHSITLCYYQSVNGDDRDVNPKDCGMVADYFGFTPVLNGDILLDFCRTEFDYLITPRKTDTLADILTRVESAKQFKTPTEYSSDACMSILKTAYGRLNFGVYDVQTIFKLAATIAQMSFSRFIMIEHIAEAIQYRSIQRDETVKFYQP